MLIALNRYPEQLAPKENCPLLGLGFRSRSGLILGLGRNQTFAFKEKCPSIRVRVWLRVSFGVEGEQFFLGAIVLEPIKWYLLLIKQKQKTFEKTKTYLNETTVEKQELQKFM